MDQAGALPPEPGQLHSEPIPAPDAAAQDDTTPGSLPPAPESPVVPAGAPAPESGSPVVPPAPEAVEHEPPALPPDPVPAPLEEPLPALRSETLIAREEGAAPAAEAPASGPTAEEAAEAQAAAARAAAEAAARAEAHARATAENAQKLEAAIETLRTRHHEGDTRHYQAFFEQERSVQGMFKSLRPLAPADRQRLWTAFKQIGTEMRRAQQEEWESRRYQSIEARENVEERIRKAETLAQGAEGAAGYRRADSILNEVRSLLGSEAPGSAGQVLIGPDRRACWDRWRKVRDLLRQARGGQQEHDYAELKDQTTEAAELAGTGDPFQAIQRIKQLQSRLGGAFLRRGQFEELRKRLSEAWLAAQARVTELRQERSQHRAEWRERMEGHVARWRETIEHKRSQREHLMKQVEKLEDMEKNARSEDFAVQVRGWRAETDEKLKHTDELIADLEQRIRDALKRVGGGRGSRGGQERRGGRGGGPREGGPREGGQREGGPRGGGARGRKGEAPAQGGETPAVPQPGGTSSAPPDGEGMGGERGPEYGPGGEVLPPPDESGPPPEGVGGP